MRNCPPFGAFLTNLPDATSAEQTEQLCAGKSFRVERITSAGQHSPPDFWYDQAWDEWVMVVQGSAILFFKDPDETICLTPGDWVMISAHRRHRIEETSREPATVWIAVHEISQEVA